MKKSSSFTCPFRGDRWIVVTSILYPTVAIHKFLNLTTKWNLIVIGDRKTPHDWFSHLQSDRSRVIFLSIEEQLSLDYSIIRYLPENSYTRKNIGYLVAIACGAKIIFESDDDNILLTDDIHVLPKVVKPDDVPWVAFHRQRSPFVNIYGSFGHQKIWPRGFPIDELRNVTEDGWHSVRRNKDKTTYAYIQQYLADLDPDVDANYRVSNPFSIGQIKFDPNQPPVAIEPFTFSPYNTQNTITHYEAFWGLFLPVTTTFRVCDIWRSFWVQRLLWEIDGRLVFSTSTVKQVRNAHSYIKDMEKEQQLYNQSGSFVRFLASWSSSFSSLPKKIAQLARDIAQSGFWHQNEISIIDAWLADLHSVGYTFPSIISRPPPRTTIQKRAAICVTGLTECIEEAWAPTDSAIRQRLLGDIDTFIFLSSSLVKGPVPIDTRLKQVRSYPNSTVTVIYEDRVIDPKIPADCHPEFQLPGGAPIPVVGYFQQLWALAECYDLVKDYGKRFNIEYQLLIRARIDALIRLPSTLDRNDPFNVNTTVLIPPNRYYPNLHDDGFAIGPMKLMYYFMTRWYTLRNCPPDIDYQPGKYLKKHLSRFMNVTVDKDMTGAADAIQHGPNKCH
ncbi:unnamed protein product [Adineta steineri]|uniref:Uncharacterized protein n=1 Tax=Adineta steineri TaxID=433720 RepID=A0A814WAS4_9BILA|nr:unnamed protein product [Adineta steineri]CAF3530878.1 unnamed protein product [Adineta steineri]CAF3879746.1 unnamed protein product [Adineta steineri]